MLNGLWHPHQSEGNDRGQSLGNGHGHPRASVCGHSHFCIHVHCYVAFFPDITPCWTKGPFKCLIKFKPGIIYSLVRKTLQPILMHSSSVSVSSLSSMLNLISRVVLVFLCLTLPFAHYFFVLTLRACRYSIFQILLDNFLSAVIIKHK